MKNNLLSHRDITLRALEPEDLEHLFRWENDTATWRVSNTLTPISRFVLRQYLEQAHRDIYEAKQLRLIIQHNETERPLGAIDLFDFDPYHKRAGIGILIAHEADRGKGYARQALQTVTGYAFHTLGLHQLYASMDADNTASLELFRKEGFEITGTRREWIWTGEGYGDEYFLQKIR